MKRKEFIKKSILGAVAASTIPITAKESNSNNKSDQVGHNHLPNKEIKTMNTVIHKSETRGHANHGWLDTHHTFSFANYYNPERMNFGAIRVLNDDVIAPGTGFGKHPHDNMEIISIPLAGSLKHQDSTGTSGIIKKGEIQVMSAGTGIQHSEFNGSESESTKFLQIWLFPNQKNVTPRYDQISLTDIYKKNEFYQILSPTPNDEGVWIHQNAWFNLGDFNGNQTKTYELNDKSNGLYVFVLNGEVKINDEILNSRDGIGLWNTDKIDFTFSQNSELLLMEVPMQF